jgi:hypothetical protein
VNANVNKLNLLLPEVNAVVLSNTNALLNLATNQSLWNAVHAKKWLKNSTNVAVQLLNVLIWPRQNVKNAVQRLLLVLTVTDVPCGNANIQVNLAQLV